MENVRQQEADICLISEGAYPYIFGGVSAWTHDLIGSLKEYTFHVMTLMPESAQLEPRYVMPKMSLAIRSFWSKCFLREQERRALLLIPGM